MDERNAFTKNMQIQHFIVTIGNLKIPFLYTPISLFCSWCFHKKPNTLKSKKKGKKEPLDEY